MGLTLTLADRVQRELDAEAHAVGDGEQPCVDVAHPRAQHDAPMRLLLRAGLLEILNVAWGDKQRRISRIDGVGEGEGAKRVLSVFPNPNP